MTQTQQNFCFCTLALGQKYRIFTQQLSEDLKTQSPGTFLFVYTDEPKDFLNNSNVKAYKYHQQGILFCYHDRRFVIEKALAEFQIAIHIDADTRILSKLPDVQYFPGIIARQENLLHHVEKYNPERVAFVKKVASKLNIALENAPYIGESLYFVGKDNGKEREFIKYWGMIGNYLELQGIHAGDGIAIGLAATKVGWTINSNDWEKYCQVTKHLDASFNRQAPTWFDQLQRRLGYQYRKARSRLLALKDFDFFYR